MKVRNYCKILRLITKKIYQLKKKKFAKALCQKYAKKCEETVRKRINGRKWLEIIETFYNIKRLKCHFK